MTIRSWDITEWRRAGQWNYETKGDFFAMSGLYYDIRLGGVRRLPSFDAFTNWAAGFDTVMGAFYDAANGRYYFVGKTSGGNLANSYYEEDWGFGATNDLGKAVSGDPLTRYHKNVIYWGGFAWYAVGSGSPSGLFRHSDLSASVNSYYTVTQPNFLVPYGDRLFVVNVAGSILLQDEADTTLEVFFVPRADLTSLDMLPFHQFLLYMVAAEGGWINLNRVTDTTVDVFHDLTTVQGVTGVINPNSGVAGIPAVVVGDVVYFLSGNFDSLNKTRWSVFGFDGRSVEHIAYLPLVDVNFKSVGLHVWREQLILHIDQKIYMLHGGAFTVWTESLAVDAPLYVNTKAYRLGDELCVVATSDSNEGFYHTGTGLMDGYVESSWLPMNTPSLEKQLHGIAVVLDSSSSSVTVTIKYRADFSDTWITAVSAADSRLIRVDNIRAAFYWLQVRVEIADESLAGVDVAIVSLGISYSVPAFEQVN